MADSEPLQKNYNRQNGFPSEVSATKKYVTFSMNVLFWLCGLLMVIVGLYAKTAKYQQSDLLTSIPWFLDPANFILGVGVILFVIPFLGCIGSLRENIVLLKVYEYTIAVLCIVQLALVIYVSIDSERVKKVVEEFLKKSIPSYRNDPDLQSIIDWTQENMECCGVRDYMDWERNVYFQCREPDKYFLNPDACGVPHSCCRNYPKEKNTDCGQKMRDASYYGTRENFIYTEGCIDVTADYLFEKRRLYLLCVVGALVVLLEITSMGLAHALVNDIKTQQKKYEREQRRAESPRIAREGYEDTRLM